MILTQLIYLWIIWINSEKELTKNRTFTKTIGTIGVIGLLTIFLRPLKIVGGIKDQIIIFKTKDYIQIKRTMIVYGGGKKPSKSKNQKNLKKV